jgi:hypothetical protein
VLVNAVNATQTHMGSFVDGSHPGTIDLAITTDISSRISKRQALGGLVLGAGVFSWETCIRVDVLPSAGDAYILQAGALAQAAGLVETQNGVYFFADQASANWSCKTAQGGARQANDSGVALVIDTWFNLKFEVDVNASVVNYFIDGAFVATETLDIPVVAIESTISLTGPVGGTGQAVVMTDDYIYWEKGFVPPR